MVAPSLAAPFDGETPEPYGGNPYGGNPFGGNPFGGYQMRSVAPMYEEKTIDDRIRPFQINPSPMLKDALTPAKPLAIR